MRGVVSWSFCAVIAACGPSGSAGPRILETGPLAPDRADAAEGGSGGSATGAASGAPSIDHEPARPSLDATATVGDAAPVDTGPAPPPADAAGPVADAAPFDSKTPVDVRPAPADGAAPDRNADHPPDVAADHPPDVTAADATGAACLPTPAPDEIVSTFEDGSLKASATAGRDATSWYLINTGSGASATLTVVDQPLRCSSRRFLRFSGMATATQIPITRVLLLSSGSMPFYDARARGYQGVRLSMRATVATHVAIKVPDRNTSSVGGICTACSDHFIAELDVPPVWTSYTLPFASLKQSGVGDPQLALDVGALFGIEIVVRTPAAFDLSVDDVSFYR
jgi:hypothetical protein